MRALKQKKRNFKGILAYGKEGKFQTSTSDPLLISCETLLKSLAKVTFFSNFGSEKGLESVTAGADALLSENVVSFIFGSESAAFKLLTLSER